MNEDLIDKMIEEYEERIRILQNCISTLKAQKARGYF